MLPSDPTSLSLSVCFSDEANSLSLSSVEVIVSFASTIRRK